MDWEEGEQSKDRSEFNWLYPELLSKDGLLQILKQRYIKQADLDQLEKEELMELYYKYVLPLPQRKYRMNRRGRNMTKKQIKLAKKRKILEKQGDGEPPKKKTADDVATLNSRFLTSFSDPSAASDRLKPPPTNCVDFSKKTIKLSSGTKVTSTETSSTLSDSSAPKKKFTPISFSSASDASVDLNIKTFTMKSVPNNVTKSPVQNTINLINKHLSVSSATDAGKTKNTKGSQDKKSESDKQVTAMDVSPTQSQKPQVNETAVPRKKIKLKRIPVP